MTVANGQGKLGLVLDGAVRARVSLTLLRKEDKHDKHFGTASDVFATSMDLGVNPEYIFQWGVYLESRLYSGTLCDLRFRLAPYASF